jgi:large subunit ribosomal protein L4
MKLEVHNQKTGITVHKDLFGAAFNEPLIHQVVTAYLSGGRAGTSAQKTRAQVRGGGKKPWKQKGSGRARAGTIRSPLWRGGGKVFAAVTQDYSQKLNKKMYRAAMRSIFGELVRQDRLIIVKDLAVEQPKTKILLRQLDEMGVSRGLLVTEGDNQNLILAARNLHQVNVCGVAELNPVALVGSDKVVMTVDAVKKVEEWLA